MKKAEGFVSISSGLKSENGKRKCILHLLSVILPFVAHKACTDQLRMKHFSIFIVFVTLGFE